MTEWDIQLALFYHFQGQRDDAIPNVYLSLGEADIINFTKAGYLHEFEIKISKSDFKADFKNKKRKHFYFKTGNVRFYKTIPNCFSYVCPENLIDIKDIPEYAGLYYAKNRGLSVASILCIKPPPKIHKKKCTKEARNKLMNTLYWKYWNLSKNLHQYNNKFEPWLEFMGDENHE